MIEQSEFESDNDFRKKLRYVFDNMKSDLNDNMREEEWRYVCSTYYSIKPYGPGVENPFKYA